MIKVLLVEENPLFRDALTGSINRCDGFLVTSAPGIDEALKKLSAEAADIIIIDIAEMEQAECLKMLDRLNACFNYGKVVLIGSRKRVLTKAFQNELLCRHIMSFTYDSRNLNGLIALLHSVNENYTSYPEASDSLET